MKSRAILAFAGIACLVGVGLGLPGPTTTTLTSAAIAETAIPPVSAWAIAVPGSVLTGAAQGQFELPPGQLAALLANKTPFSFKWAGIEAVYGTASPATPSAADAAIIAEIEAAFAPVATEAAAVATVPAGATVGVTVVAGAAAAALSANAEKALGIIHDGDVCGAAPGAFSAVDNVLATVTFTDCNTWTLSQDQIAHANADVGALANFAIGSQSCLQGTCGTIYAGPVPEAGQASNYYDYCVSSPTPNAFPNTYSTYGSAVTMVTTSSPPSTSSNLWYGGAPWSSSPNIYSGCTSTVPGAASYGIVPAGNTSYADAVPYTAWESAWGADLVTGGTPTRLDISRSYRCVVTLASGASVTNTVSAGQEGNGSFSEPECPGVGPNDAPTRVQIFLTSPSSPTGEVSIYDQATTSAYQSWKAAYPECGNGSCLLDLRQNSVSCLFQQIDCEGWITSPTRSSDYSCYYGTHLVDLSECFVYGTTFSESNRLTGHAYADPATGSSLPDVTSANETIKVAAEIVQHQVVTGYSFSPVPDFAGAAKTVAEECLAQVDVTATTSPQPPGTIPIAQLTENDCETLPIFAPGTADIHDAAQHDFDAIVAGQPSVLHYMGSAEKQAGPNAVQPGWYGTPSAGACGPGYVAAETHCDEYPYYSSAEGGPGASLRNINAGDNRREGTLLYGFAVTCGLAGQPASEATKYIVVPTDAITMAYCGH